MAGKKLTSNDFVAEVNKRAYPSDVAFPHNGRAHTYSGPFSWIRNAYVPLLGKRMTHGERAAIRAKADNELLIDDSEPGKYLITFQEEGMKGFGVYSYFTEVAGLSPLEIQSEGDRPWIRASRLFVRSLWGNVSTTVCGADRKRVFCKLEIPYMMTVIPQLIEKMRKTKDIEFLNDFPTKVFRTSFSSSDFEKAFKLICLTERRKAFRRGLDTGNLEDYADYLDTLEMSVLDHHVQGKNSKHPLSSNASEDERLAWKTAAMEAYANKALRFIDAELGVLPKKIVVVSRLPKSLRNGPK